MPGEARSNLPSAGGLLGASGRRAPAPGGESGCPLLRKIGFPPFASPPPWEGRPHRGLDGGCLAGGSRSSRLGASGMLSDQTGNPPMLRWSPFEPQHVGVTQEPRPFSEVRLPHSSGLVAEEVTPQVIHRLVHSSSRDAHRCAPSTGSGDPADAVPNDVLQAPTRTAFRSAGRAAAAQGLPDLPQSPSQTGLGEVATAT